MKMKKLNELFPDIASNTEVTGIKINSKEVEKGDIFVCTMGVTADRHDFIDERRP
jgi:UDP-N-acetylmuramoyl-L-alanyl-D-glutamate--2,6-diaminopimelate ligase